MIKLLILLFTLLFVSCSYAEDHYVFIHNGIGYEDRIDKKIGQSDNGDIVDILPVNTVNGQYNPTRAELSRYRIFIVDLNEKEKAILLDSDVEKEGTENQALKRPRKVKIDLGLFINKNNLTIIPHDEFIQAIIVKSDPDFVIP